VVFTISAPTSGATPRVFPLDPVFFHFIYLHSFV